ncbi:MAG: hypothetical protein QM689_00555 [Oscillospiraceae bacterium]
MKLLYATRVCVFAAMLCCAALLTACGTDNENYRTFDITTIGGGTTDAVTTAETGADGRITPAAYLKQSLIIGDLYPYALNSAVAALAPATFLYEPSATPESILSTKFQSNGAAFTFDTIAAKQNAAFLYLWFGSPPAATVTPDALADQYETLITHLRTLFPDATICVLSAVSAEQSDVADYNDAVKARVAELNDVRFLDVSAALESGDFAPDGELGLSEEGYLDVYRFLLENRLDPVIPADATTTAATAPTTTSTQGTIPPDQTTSAPDDSTGMETTTIASTKKPASVTPATTKKTVTTPEETTSKPADTTKKPAVTTPKTTTTPPKTTTPKPATTPEETDPPEENDND